MCSCLLPTLFLWLSLALMPLVLVTASIFSRSLVLSSSISLAVAPPSPHLLYFLMEASAISLASDSILEASLLASASRLSFFSASFSTSVSKALFSFSISALLFFMRSSSSSMNCLLLLSSAITSSKRLSLVSILFAASSIISSDSPNFFDIAKALLLPGIPMRMR